MGKEGVVKKRSWDIERMMEEKVEVNERKKISKKREGREWIWI